MHKKVIYDTDIGSDIDDAVCLAYLLKQKSCELLGITTVSGESEKRAMIADSICEVAHKNIPIFPGAEKPLVTEQRQKEARQSKMLGNWEHRTEFPRNKAIDFMRETIHDNPGEISLLATGPLTNIALLFSVDPDIPFLLKEVVLMCGVFKTEVKTDPVEWNSLCDPFAASIVFNTPVKNLISVGLDVTMQVVMDKADINRMFTADVLKPVIDFSSIWFEHSPRITFHDPLAGAVLFDASLCGYEKGTVAIELENSAERGKTCWTPEAGSGKQQIAVTVDKDRFFKHYFDVVNGCN